MRAHKKNRNKEGFTLTEVLLLLSLIGVILAGVLPLFLNVITVNKQTELLSKAYKDLDSKVEELRNKSFDSLITETNFTVPNLPQGAGSVAVIDSPNNIPNLKQVTVVVTWNFRGNKSIRATTFVARGGLK